MNYMLIVQAGYHTYSIGIGYADGTLIAQTSGDKHATNKELLLRLEALLHSNGITMQQICVIGVNQGPGPFTSVRVAITIANALSYAHNIPLAGLNNIAEIINEYALPDQITVALLDAYHQDMYYAIHVPSSTEVSVGYENKQVLLHNLATQFPHETICFLGQGTTLVEPYIHDIFKERTTITHHAVDQPSLAHLCKKTAQLCANNKQSMQILTPLYLKSMQYKTQ